MSLGDRGVEISRTWLPSALLVSRFHSSVHYEVPYVKLVLQAPPRHSSNPVRSLVAGQKTAQSPGTRFRLRPARLDPAFSGYAAAVCGSSPRCTSNASCVTHSRCIRTVSFRATAITARFFAFFPPLVASDNPHRRNAQSDPNGPRMYWADCVTSLRNM